MSRRPTLLAVAHHECGHAVARCALSSIAPAPRIKAISIVPCETHMAEVVMDPRIMMATADYLPPMPAICRGIRMDIIETLAGPLAEMRHSSQGWVSGLQQCGAIVLSILDEGHRPDADQDTQDVFIRLEKLLAREIGDPLVTLTRLWRAAWALVELEWAGIRKMANRLADRQEMAGAEFEALWRSMRPAAHYRKRAEKALGEAFEDLRWATAKPEEEAP